MSTRHEIRKNESRRRMTDSIYTFMIRIHYTYIHVCCMLAVEVPACVNFYTCFNIWVSNKLIHL